ncbi:MAG: hypothetical protein ACLRFI_02680 [Alphaproteobacteria bacterium]
MLIDIPANFDSKLPNMLSTTHKWTQLYNTGTLQKTENFISFYSPKNAYSTNYIILVPGLGTNATIDPLMQTISYWALTHKFNLFHISTFINIPNQNICPDLVRTQNWHEYTEAINSALSIIKQETKPGYKCAIGHSAGANGLISTLNQNVQQNKKTDLSSIMLFAPFVTGEWFKILIEFSQKNNPETPDLVYIWNTFNQLPHSYFPVTKNFLAELTDQPFEPELMNKWGIPTTLIAGEADRKAPIKDLRQKFDTLKHMPNGNNFRFVPIPNTKHNFLNLKQSRLSILEILKSQKVK